METNIIVTTGDLKRAYEVIGPVYFQISNKGVIHSALERYKQQYKAEIQAMKNRGTMSQSRTDWGFLYGEWSVGQNDFEAAFFIAVEELKKRAKMVGGDAVICMRQDIDIDTNGFSYFYLQMYGTAVRYVGAETPPAPESRRAAVPQYSAAPAAPVVSAAAPGEVPAEEAAPTLPVAPTAPAASAEAAPAPKAPQWDMWKCSRCGKMHKSFVIQCPCGGTKAEASED